jgi:competence protein ComEC
MALSPSLFSLITKTKIEHKRTLSISIFLILICLVVLKTKESKNWPISNWQFVMCDVGQGDGLVLRDSTGKVLVVDVGPNGQLMNDCLKKLGVKTIDVLMLTHFHADHVEGLELVKNRHKIDKVYLTWVEDPIYEVERTRQLLNGIQTSHITSGEVISLGEMKIQCLWPTKIKMHLDSIPNNASLVNLVTIKNASFLLTGDIEPPAQEAIQKLWKIPQVDVVKVPHHGSKFQDANFPKWTRARLALISVGQENSYGHPAKLTLDLYRDSGMQVLSTDEVGSIAIGISADDSIRVSTKD